MKHIIFLEHEFFRFLGQFSTLKIMVTKIFQNSDFSYFLGIKSEINQCWNFFVFKNLEIIKSEVQQDQVDLKLISPLIHQFKKYKPRANMKSHIVETQAGFILDGWNIALLI